jgi:NADH-quinone oxidoreductase subunit F
MTRDWRQIVLGGIAIVAGAAVLLAGGVLTVDAFRAQSGYATALDREDALRTTGESDAEIAPELHEFLDEYTATTLTREQRLTRWSWIALIAAIVAVASTKWLVALRQPHPRAPRDVVSRWQAKLSARAPAAPAVKAGVPLPQADPIDLAPLDDIIARHGAAPAAAIPILQAIQRHYHYLPAPALRRVTERTEITPAQIAGLATFYSGFRHTPTGAHVITVCHGTACHVAGAERITDELRRQLGVAPGTDTDAARHFTVQAVPCLGCCTLAPVVQTDGHTHGHVQPGAVDALIAAATQPAAAAPSVQRDVSRDGDMLIRLGMGSCCQAGGADRVATTLERALARQNVDTPVQHVGCVGMCHQTPFVEVIAASGESTFYSRVQPPQVRAIVRRHVRPRGLAAQARAALATTRAALPWRRRNGDDDAAEIALDDRPVAAFLDPQVHIATEHCGSLDPLDADDYIARDGFVALRDCDQHAPAEIVDIIRRSGLRGRGGAGFPTGEKWSCVAAAPGDTKYVICNGDEGDPGAFMDRMLMESYPLRIIEGLAIAARAVGARAGYFYIRAEYPLAVERIRAALDLCNQRGLLGDLELHVVQGAGAFVCGEETALIASLEGRRGTPTYRPPYPAERGLFGCPTLVNNVETLAVVPWIVRHGPAAFATLGTPRSPGTKVFALAGKVLRGGLIEVPMGITIRQVVEEIGGGVRPEPTAAGPRPRRFKAVQIGGPSGGCLPAALADTPIDFEALADAGAIMGSGGLVVLDETDCMVDIARYFLEFTQGQSCGKCVPCRIGTRRMLEILERLCRGQAAPDDLDTLEDLARNVGQTSLCGLGKTAPNPVLTTLHHFRDEYEAHLAGVCPAGRCPDLVAYRVTSRCVGCTLCAQHCPVGAIDLQPYEQHEIDLDKCTRCDLCRVGCPEAAIEVS